MDQTPPPAVGAARLTAQQRTNLLAKLLSADPNKDTATDWIAKNFSANTLVRRPGWGVLRYGITPSLDRSTASAPPPEWLRWSGLAHTVEAWQGPIIAALQTGLVNARSDGYNRVVKHVGRIAFGYRIPTTNAAEYGEPAPNHGESPPAGTDATANCEESKIRGIEVEL